MSVERTEARPQLTRQPATAPADWIARLRHFEGSPAQFLSALLAAQCRHNQADGGIVLRFGSEKQADIVAVHPPPSESQAPPPWLQQAAEVAAMAAGSGVSVIQPLHEAQTLYGQPARRHLIAIPCDGGILAHHIAVFSVAAASPPVLENLRERLELTMIFLGLYEARLSSQHRQAELQRLRVAMDVLAVCNEPQRFVSAAMALCNEIVARWRCERVGIGFLRGRYVRLQAMSHTEKFSRKMQRVQHLESAMEECLDQDLEIAYPAPSESAYVSRAAGELSTRYGGVVVLSLPLRKNGRVEAVLTLERLAHQPFSPEEIESLRLTSDLFMPRLATLYQQDRWVGAKMVSGVKKAAEALVGPRHAWVKLLVAAVLVLMAFLFFARGDYEAEAPFTLEATQRQVIPAPFDGYLQSVHIQPGEAVDNKTILATFDTAELRLQLGAAKAEYVAYQKQADAALRDEKIAEAQIAQAQADKTAGQIKLLEYRISQSQLISPLAGCVVIGDLKRQIGAPFKTGDVLFEVAPLDSLLADLSVPEDQITDLAEHQDGELATASYPRQRIGFVVERINPVAEVVNQRNVFKVRVKLASREPWMRPGMEGVAKVHLGKRNYAYLWTRRLVNWIRMQWWL